MHNPTAGWPEFVARSMGFEAIERLLGGATTQMLREVRYVFDSLACYFLNCGSNRHNYRFSVFEASKEDSRVPCF
jgi:hypothetical protein